MAKKLTSVLGIDIGSETIKVCEIKAQGRQPVVTAIGIAPTPAGAVDHTGVYNSDAVGVALKQAIADSGATTPFAVVTIAGQASVLVRTLEVPKMNPAELKDHMRWEIDRNIPFAESTVLSDFKPLGNDDPNSANMDVVMAISPQSAADTIIACLKKAGKTTAALDVEPLSIARVLSNAYEDQYGNQSVCVVEVGAKTTSINIYQGAKLLMPRQVPVGGELFTGSISSTLGLSGIDAESAKRDRLEIPENAGDAWQANQIGYGGGTGSTTQEFQPFNPFADAPIADFGAAAPANPFAEPVNPFAEPANPFADVSAPAGYGGAAAFGDLGGFDELPPVDEAIPAAPDSSLAAIEVNDPEGLYAAILPILEELTAEIRRSIDYFRSRGGQIDVVLLTGGGTKIRGLKTYLCKVLALPCDDLDPLRRLNTNLRKATPQFVDDHRAELAIAVGNGLFIFFD